MAITRKDVNRYMQSVSAPVQIPLIRKRRAWRAAKRHALLYLILAVPVLYVFLFSYVPMYGILLSFKDFQISLGISGSPWAGLKHFEAFFRSPNFSKLLINTIGLSLYSMVAGFFPPVILAVMLNECRSAALKKTVQTVTFAPYFLSTVILVGMVTQVLSYTGIVNSLLSFLGAPPVDFLGDPKMFKHVYVWSGVWQGVGYSSVLYVATLASVSPDLYEAAAVEGANIWQKIRYVDLPSIVPTAVIMLILNSANVLNVGFEKVYLLQNPLNMRSSDIISTFVYRTGLVNMQYDYSTAVGLFQSVVSLLMITSVNAIARRLGETSLW